MPHTRKPRYLCRHIHTAGNRCGSPAVRDQEFCFYHHNTHTRRTRPTHQDDHFDLPDFDDRASIQLGLAEISRRILTRQLDPRRAGLLLYALQIASSNLPRETNNTRTINNSASTPKPQVEEFTLHPDLGPLAPIAEVPPPPEDPLGPAQSLWETLVKGPTRTEREDPHPNPHHPYPTDPTILPNVQAVAQTPPRPTPSRSTLSAYSSKTYSSGSKPLYPQPPHFAPASPAGSKPTLKPTPRTTPLTQPRRT